MGIGSLRRHRDVEAERTAAGSPRRGPAAEDVVTDGTEVPEPEAPDAGGSPREPEAAEDNATGQVVVPGEQPEGADPEVADEHVTEVTPIAEAQSEVAEDAEPEGDPEPEPEPETPVKATRSRKASSK